MSPQPVAAQPRRASAPAGATGARSPGRRRAWRAAGRPRRGSAGGGARPAPAGRAAPAAAGAAASPPSRSSPRTTWVIALVRVVDHHREVIGGGADVLAAEHDVAESGEQRRGRARWRPACAGPVSSKSSGRRAERLERAREVEADGVAGRRVGHRRGRGRCRDRPPRRGGALLRRRERGADVGAGAAAGIGEAERGQPVERGGVARQVLGLAQDRLGPGEAEPGEVVADRRLVLRAAAGARRCPRCAAGRCRPRPAPGPRRSAPRRRGRGAGARSATARSGCAAVSRRGGRAGALRPRPRRTGRSGSRRAG